MEMVTRLLMFLLVGNVVADDKHDIRLNLTNDAGTQFDGQAIKCKDMIDENVNVFEVLPGIGWDNIQNIETSQVLNVNYYKCKLTNDGNYLIPDNVMLIPVKQSDVDIYAEWFSSMNEYKSVDAFSMNSENSISVGLPFLGGVTGSFSAGYQRAKLHMTKSTNSKFISRVQARYNRYRVLTDPGSELHPSFKAQLLEIASSLYNRHHKIAEYQSQVLIRDFGTHVLTRMNAGAVLYKEDHIDTGTTSVSDVQKKSWHFGAGAAFRAIFDDVCVGGDFKNGIGNNKITDAISNYTEIVTFSVIKSYGGTYFDKNTAASDWIQSLDNNLVPIDRDGVPLFELITSTTLPELPLDTILKLGQTVKNAFHNYYKHNTYRGCMDPSKDKFDIRANVPDDAVCGDNIFENEYFGGVYQTCTMSQTDAGDTCTNQGYNQKNPLTGDYSCPSGYKMIELISETITDSQYHAQHPTILHLKRHSYTTYSRGQYTAYWCARDPLQSPDQKYFFGGVFSPHFKPNTLTGGFSCPVDFIQLRIAFDVYICASGNGNVIGIKFGGFFSCSYGNPIALTLNMTQKNAARVFDSDPNTWPKRCPHGMLQQTFSISSNCELEFCSEAVKQDGKLQLPALKRPPFIQRPIVPPGNYTEMVILNNGSWYKNEAAFEKMVEMETLDDTIKIYQKAQDSLGKASLAAANLYSDISSTTSSDKPSNPGSDQTSLPPYAIVIISSFATIVCIALATLAVLMYRKVKHQNVIGRVAPLTETNYGSLQC